MDKATIIEHALDLLGEHNHALHSGTSTTSESHYPAVLRECVASHHWSFARRRTTLEPTAPHEFTLPLDCLRIFAVCRPDSTAPYPEPIDHWQLYDRTIVAPEHDRLLLIYTSDYTIAGRELPDSAPYFCQYAIHTLASRIAPTICGGEIGLTLAQSLLARASDYKNTALINDRQQDASNDQRSIDRLLSTHRKFHFLY